MNSTSEITWIYSYDFEEEKLAPGWYARQYCWEAEEGSFVAGHYWNGKNWNDCTYAGTISISSIVFKTEAEAENGWKNMTTASSRVWTCPYAHQQYQGKCPVTKCWANIANHDSGCIHHLFGGRLELSVAELAYAKNQSKQQIGEAVEKGKRFVGKLYYFRSRVDEIKSDSVKAHCPHCGIASNGPCVEKGDCNNRIRYYDRARKHKFFVAVGGMTPGEFYLFLNKNPRKRKSFLKGVGFKRKSTQRLINLL